MGDLNSEGFFRGNPPSKPTKIVQRLCKAEAGQNLRSFGGNSNSNSNNNNDKKNIENKNWLVVEPTHLKNMSQNGNLPPTRDENTKYLETTT